MPPTIRKDAQRQAQSLFVNPQRTIRSVATGQQGGHSGTIPGTSSDPTQLAMQWSTIQPPDTGDQVAAVGHAVVANDGTPVVVMGNMNVTGDSGYPPEAFQDGGFAFTDASGNAVAGYSHPTGLWGFGGGGTPGAVVAFYIATNFIGCFAATQKWRDFSGESPADVDTYIPVMLAPSTTSEVVAQAVTTLIYYNQNPFPTFQAGAGYAPGIGFYPVIIDGGYSFALAGESVSGGMSVTIMALDGSSLWQQFCLNAAPSSQTLTPYEPIVGWSPGPNTGPGSSLFGVDETDTYITVDSETSIPLSITIDITATGSA